MGKKHWVAPIFKTLTWGTKIISEISPVRLGSACGLASGPCSEAQLRCTSQPSTTAIPWSSGSSRRRQPWMHRTKMAAASEEDFGGFRCEEVNEDVDGLSFLWSRLYILDYVFKKRIWRSTFCYRTVLIKGHRLACALQSKKCSGLPEFPLWCELMWQLYFCRSHDSNPNCFFLSLLVRPCSASHMKCQEQRNKTEQLFSSYVVSQSGVDLFARVGVCLSLLWFTLGLSKHILIANMADTALIEHQRQQLLQPIRCSQDMSCSLSSGRNIEWPQFPKLRLLRHQNFLRNFSPSVGFCLWLGLGLRLPRQHTPARGSRQRPRLRGRAAPGGEGGRGCTEPIRPWPQRRMLGEETSWGLGIPLWREVKENKMWKWTKCWWFKFFVRYCFQMFPIFVEGISQKTFCTNIWCFFLPSRFLRPFLLQCTDKTCSNDDFSLAIFCSTPQATVFSTNSMWSNHPENILKSTMFL